MIFGRHKSYGREAGSRVLSTMQLAAMGTRLCKSGTFQPTIELFMDSYVAGFVIGSVTASLTAAGGAACREEQTYSARKKPHVAKANAGREEVVVGLITGKVIVDDTAQ